MSATFEFSSPLDLIIEWRDSGEKLTEALVLGYTIDLPFLERYFIGQARGIGARVTVLSDVHQSTHDDVDVRKAGRSYLHGQVLCAGAFHPKLTVFLNEERVWIAVGSGNPTTSGWGHNDELWLVVRSSTERGPAAFNDLAQWLEDLPQVVQMPSWVGESVENVARQIRPQSIDHSVGALHILGNLRRSLISQLPVGPTAQLNLSAPFLDPHSSAVVSLVERFEPQRVAIGIQPTLGRYDGSSLVHALASAPAHEVRYLDESRTSHGKLVEWSAGGEWRALVGSPNLSAAALLRATNDHGNCELAALYPNSAPLLRDGGVATTADLTARRTISDGQDAETAQVARAKDEDVAHHLLRPGSAYGRIARATAVEDLVKRARDTRDDPAREKVALLDSIGFSVELRDGAWVADIGESRNTRWAAARIAEVIGQPCCVIVVSDHGTSCIIWVDKDIAHADSRTGLWKLFRVKVVGGPSSTIAGPDGLRGARRTCPLRESDHEVEKLSHAAGVDSRRIATFFATAND